MDLENNFTDFSLPENNPLLQTLGVIEVSEKNNQNIVAPAFIEEKFSSDNHVTVLVGENFPDSWTVGDNDKRREDFIKPLENLASSFGGDWYNENEFDIRDGFRYWRFFFNSRDNAEKFITQTNSFLNEKLSDFQNILADTSDKKIEPEIQKNSAQEIDFTLNNFSSGQQNLFGDFPETQLTPEELLKSAKLFSDDAKDKFRAEFFGHYINLSRAQSYYEERQGNFKVSIPPSSSNKKLLNQLTKLAEKIDGSVDTSDKLYPVFYFKNLDNARTFAKSLEFLFDNETSKVDEDLRTSAEISHEQAEFEKQVKAEQKAQQAASSHLGDEKFSFDDIPDGAGFETDDGIFTFNRDHSSFYNIDAHYFVEMDGILDRALTRMWRFGDVNKAVEAIDYELKFDKIVWRDEQQANEVKNLLKNNAENWNLVFDVYDDGSEILRGADAEKAIREKISNSKNSVADSEFDEDFSENNLSDIQTQISENISHENSVADLLKDATIEPVIYTSPDTGEIYHTHYPDGFSVEYSTFNIRDGYHGNGNSSGYEYSSKSFRDAFQYVQNHKNDTDKFFLGNDDVVAHYKIIKNNPHPLALGVTLFDFNFSTKQETFFDEKIKDFVKDIVPEKISEVPEKTPYEIAFDTFEDIKQKYNNHEISIDQAVSDADFTLQQFKNSSMILDSRKVDTLQSFVDSLVNEQKEIQKNSTDTPEINFDKKILDEANSPDSNLEHFSNYFSSMEKVLKRYNQGDISIYQAVSDSKIIVENWKNSLIIADSELNNKRLKILQTFSQYFIDKQNNISQNVSDTDTADKKFFILVYSNQSGESEQNAEFIAQYEFDTAQEAYDSVFDIKNSVGDDFYKLEIVDSEDLNRVYYRLDELGRGHVIEDFNVKLSESDAKSLQMTNDFFASKNNDKIFEIVTPNGESYHYSATADLDLAIHSGAIVDERNHILVQCSDDDSAGKILADIQNAFNSGKNSFEISLPEKISEQNKSKYLLRRQGRYGDVSNFFYEDFETAMRNAKNDINNGTFVNVQIFNDSNEIFFEWNIGDKNTTEKFEIGTFTHTKTNEKIPSAKLTEKVDRDTYLKLNSLAKNHGGSYSKFAKQFLFKTSDERDAFIANSAKIFENNFETSQPEIISDVADENSTQVESLDDSVVQKNISPAESQTDNPFDKMVAYTNDFNQSFDENFEFVTDENDSVIDIIDKKTDESAVTESNNEKFGDEVIIPEVLEDKILDEVPLEAVKNSDEQNISSSDTKSNEKVHQFLTDIEQKYENYTSELPKNVVIDVPFEEISQNDNEKIFQQILTEDAAQIRGNSLEKNIFRKNLLAIRTLKRLESEDRLPNADELKILQDFSGFGAIPNAFDKDNPDWYREAWLLHSALTDDEYNSLRASSLNAYYTPPEVVNSIFNALEKMGFESGNILEPSVGIGNFFKNMPDDMKNSSHLFGVELDSITSRIAQKIFPDAEISEQGFETTTYLNNSFDVAFGNVPFGDYRINDKQYGSPLIHDYFIAKMLDQVRAGGLVAVVTHKGTMDKGDNSARKLFAKKADLVRAFRLPNNTFKNSKTSVTTDILIFQKLDKERDIFDELPNWVHTAPFNGDDDISINRYFLDNPDDVIGTFEKVSSPYGFDLTCKPSENLPLAETLENLTNTLQKNFTAVENLPVPKQIDSADKIQPLSFFVEDNEFKFFDGEKTEVVKIPSSDRELILQAINIRNAVRNILNIQLENGSDSELSFAQDNLKFAYDHFVKNFGRIQLNAKLKKLFKKDSAYYLLCSLENYDKDKNFVGVSEIFSERTVTIHEKPTHADNSAEALMISMQEQGKVSIPYISSLTDKSEHEIISELEFDRIFFDFKKQEYQIAEEFLSGDIRQKIDDLQDKLFSIDNEFSADISKKILNFHDDITHYEPKNELERAILNAESYRYFDFSQNPELEKYIFENQKNYQLLVHVAAKQGSFTNSDSEISKLISRHPLAILDAVQHLNKPIFEYSNDSTSRFIHRYLDFMQETEILDENNSNYDEHKNLVFAFLREHLTPFEKNPELLEKVSLIDGSPQKIQEDVSIDDKHYTFSGIEHSSDKIYRPEVEADWKNFQETFQQNKKNLIDNFDFAHSDKFHNFFNTKQRIQKNLAALEQVKPKDLSAADIHVELGATWIPVYDIKQFLCDTLAIQHSNNLNVNFAPITGAWEIEGKKYNFGPKSEITFGVENYMNALVLAENALNGRQSKIYKTVYVDGKETKQIDNEKTIVAQQKTELIKQAFQNWIFNDEERKNRLVAYYNRHFNNIKPREFDGSHLTFPGMSSKIKLREHQKNAIAHTLYGGNTLFAHCVGAGKTFEMAASAMEAKRLGLCSKSMIVVPKHLTEQMGTEFLQLYPNAKILVATDKDFESDKRKEFCSRIATQNWDAVILGFTQFEKIPISKERQERLLKKQVFDLVAAIEEMKLIKSEHFSVKQAELMKKKLEARLEKLQADNTDQTVTFEQLGVDRLFIDEAHYYKNLFTYTKMSNVAGVSTTDAQKTSDLFNKCQYMNENSNGHCSIVFSTATPLSNSMTELFTMQRYLQPETLKHAGFEIFDSWASTFGKIETALELAPEGKGFRYKTRFSSFNNLPELMNMFKEIAEIKTSDQLNLDVPDAEFIVEKLQPSDEQKDFVEFLAKRAEDVHNRRVQPEDDNMLKITNDGRKLALDQRLIDPELPDDENSKVNRCVNNVFQIYSETSEKKSAQLIFCDQSTPSSGFNVYDDFKQKLIEKGVPENEIAFIHDAKKNSPTLVDDFFYFTKFFSKIPLS